MIKIIEINKTTYNLIEEIKLSSLWLSELDSELTKKIIHLATIEYTAEDELDRIKFNNKLKNIFNNNETLFKKLEIQKEDIIILKFLLNVNTKEIIKFLENKLIRLA